MERRSGNARAGGISTRLETSDTVEPSSNTESTSFDRNSRTGDRCLESGTATIGTAPKGGQMIAIPALKPVSKPFTRRTTWIGVLAGASIAAGLAGPAWSDEKVPDLGMSSSSFAWTPLTINGTIARYGTGWFDPPGGLRGPIHQHPDYPLRGNDTG